MWNFHSPVCGYGHMHTPDLKPQKYNSKLEIVLYPFIWSHCIFVHIFNHLFFTSAIFLFLLLASLSLCLLPVCAVPLWDPSASPRGHNVSLNFVLCLSNMQLHTEALCLFVWWTWQTIHPWTQGWCLQHHHQRDLKPPQWNIPPVEPDHSNVGPVLLHSVTCALFGSDAHVHFVKYKSTGLFIILPIYSGENASQPHTHTHSRTQRESLSRNIYAPQQPRCTWWSVAVSVKWPRVVNWFWKKLMTQFSFHSYSSS